jgi:hypothetical protein
MDNDPVNNNDPSGGIVAGASSGFIGHSLRLFGNAVGNAVNSFTKSSLIPGNGGLRNGVVSINNDEPKKIPITWEPLTKNILKNEVARVWRSGQLPTENDYGRVFETWYENWVIENGYSFGDANIHKNNYVMETDLIRNTSPDFFGDEQVYLFSGRTMFGFPKSKKINVDNAHAYELKAKGGGLYLSSNQSQMKGHIDNMANIFASLVGLYSKAAFYPKVTLVTTSDVKYSPGIASYAAARQVVYEHIIAEYRYGENGNFEIRFTRSIGTNYILAIRKFIF